MSDELVPCPFCGGRAAAGRTYNDETTLFKVQCMSCPAAMKGYDQSIADAIDAWNARVPAQGAPDHGALEAFREVLEAFADERNWRHQGRFDPSSGNFNGISTAQAVLSALPSTASGGAT